MKKRYLRIPTIVLALVMSLGVLAACSEDIPVNISGENDIMENNGIENDNVSTDENELSYPGIFVGPVSWSLQPDAWFSFEFTIDSDAALEIGDAILRHTFGEDTFYSITPTVSEDIERNVFLVTYELNTGAEFSVTLDKENAEILQVYHDGGVDFTITQELALEIGDAALRLVFGESVFEDSVFMVAEVTRDNAFAVWRIPRASIEADGEFPLAIIAV
jgi:hypothetical protein